MKMNVDHKDKQFLRQAAHVHACAAVCAFSTTVTIKSFSYLFELLSPLHIPGSPLEYESSDTELAEGEGKKGMEGGEGEKGREGGKEIERRGWKKGRKEGREGSH